MAQCPKGQDWPCGQCLVCSINLQRVWTARLMLEATHHAYSSFQTFTYATEPPDGSLCKDHLSQTFHRLRDLARNRGKTVRFYGTGHYGDRYGRPHYHAAVFGLLPEDQGLLEFAWSKVPGAGALDPNPSQLEPASAAYICSYVTSRHANQEFIAAGMQPQFSLMSRNPGIGLVWVPAFIKALESGDGVRYMVEHQDVPVSVQCGSRSLPLGPYLRQKLRLYFYGDTTKPRGAADLAGLKTHVEQLKHLPPLSIDSTALDQIAAWQAAQSTYKEIQQKRKEVRALQIKTRKTIYDQLRTF